MINNPIIYKFLAVDLSPTFLNKGTTNETFQQSGKQDFFRHIHWNTTRTRRLPRIKVRYDLFNLLGVTEILCSFRLVLEEKTGREIPESGLEFLEKFLAKFSFIRCRRQHLLAVELRRYSRFTFAENTINNSPYYNKSSSGLSVPPEQVSQSSWSLQRQNISRWVDRENLIYVRWNITKNST